jgi:tripartite-type tricarboxylate transporter receptor subunit TctC
MRDACKYLAAFTTIISLSVAPYLELRAAEPVADFYKGKQVINYIGYGAGGGYDVLARTLSKHMSRHLPGTPSIVNMNMPGASSMKLALHLYSVAPKDGTAFGIVNPTVLFDPILAEKPNSTLNPLELTYVGNASSGSSVLIAWRTTNIRSVEDLQTKELVLAAPSRSGDIYILPVALKNILGLKVKLVTGYPSGNDINIAIERGEIGGRAWNFDSFLATRPSWFRDGSVNVLTQFAMKKHEHLPDVPLATDLITNQADRDILETLILSTELARPFIAPPNVPADRVADLRGAFIKTMNDPAFLTEADKQQLGIDPTSGQEMEKLLRKVYAQPPDMIAKIRQVLAE